MICLNAMGSTGVGVDSNGKLGRICVSPSSSLSSLGPLFDLYVTAEALDFLSMLSMFEGLVSLGLLLPLVPELLGLLCSN